MPAGNRPYALPKAKKPNLRSNKGGALRGKARAAHVQGLNAARKAPVAGAASDKIGLNLPTVKKGSFTGTPLHYGFTPEGETRMPMPTGNVDLGMAQSLQMRRKRPTGTTPPSGPYPAKR